MTEPRIEKLAVTIFKRLEGLSAEDFQAVMNEIRWLRQWAQKPSPFEPDQPIQETLF